MVRELSKSLVLDGIAASAAIDSSGEQLDIDGLDISDLEQGLGVLNYEHRGDKDSGASANDVIGAITYAKKIFAEKDCSNARERSYWDRVKLPFVYIQAELFDGEGHPGATAAAALIRYYNRRRLPILMRYSIEGSTLEREGNVLKRCVARRVAATLKPCNRTCFSGVLSDTADETTAPPSASLEALVRNEHPTRRILGSYELEVNPVLADPVELLKNSLESLREAAALSKAISAGGYAAAPGSLSGGSALQAEDVSKEERTLRNRSLAALRDWDRKTDFRKFLKSRLSDASESFIDHFVGLVDDFHLRKQASLEGDLWKAVRGKVSAAHAPALERMRALTAELRKATETPPPAPPAPAAATPEAQLKPLSHQMPAGLHKFRGQHVEPGEVEVTSGIYKGSKLHLLGQHGEHLYVKPQTASQDDATSLKKLPIKDLGRTFKISRPPKNYLEPHLVHAAEHADPKHSRAPAQQQLLHGIDLNRRAPGIESQFPGMSGMQMPHLSGWYQSAYGKTGYVKPEPTKGSFNWSKWSRPELHEQYPVADREALYHNLAHEFFGMGAHVPTTAAFTHPKSGEKMTISERVPNAAHYDDDNDDHQFAIQQAGQNGSLDKLAMMDVALGQWDRNPGNYMVSEQAPFVHHIDNGLLFNHHPAEDNKSQIPDYLQHYHQLSGEAPSMEESPIHPHAAQWVLGLNHEDLHNRLVAAGVPAPFARASSHRLQALQQLMWNGKQPTRGEMLKIGEM
jgi:hypothetical protein